MSDTNSYFRSQRIESVDLLRGLVMALMVLDHVRDFMGMLQAPERIPNVEAPLFLTRWVTHFCAPVFVLLAGVASYFYGARRSRGSLARFLLTRGLWLIVLEMTLINVVWFFRWPWTLPMLGVIWAIGLSLIVLAALIWLPRVVILGVAVVTIGGHDALSRLDIDSRLASTGFNTPVIDSVDALWSVLHGGGKFLFFPDGSGGGVGCLALYALVPWFAVLALGYWLGPVLKDAGSRASRSFGLGVALTISFVGLRFAWPALDMHFPYEGEGWIDFLSANKYPPSLPFLLMTLGPAFLALAAFEKWRGWLVDWLLVFGRVPLFFYVLHLLIAHTIAVIWIRVDYGIWFTFMMQTPPDPPPTLPKIYIVWLAVLLIIYPACRWFMRLRQRRRDLWWLSYL